MYVRECLSDGGAYAREPVVSLPRSSFLWKFLYLIPVAVVFLSFGSSFPLHCVVTKIPPLPTVTDVSQAGSGG